MKKRLHPSNDRESPANNFPEATHSPLASPSSEETHGVDDSAESFDALPRSEQNRLRAQLRQRERLIQRDHDAWKAVPTALTEIRDRRLYRAEGFNDFGSYCQKRLKMGKSTVNRQISIGEVYDVLASTEAKILPKRERQMRPLLNLRQEAPAAWRDQVRAVWEKTVSDAAITKKPITEKSVIHARKQLGFDPKKDPQPELDLEALWKRTEDRLCHQRKFWPIEHLPEMCARVIELMRRWAPEKGQQVDHSADGAVVARGAASQGGPESRKSARTCRHFPFWELLNWRLHNRDLAAIWKLNPLTVRQMRLRKRHGRARSGDPELYAQEIEAEKAKALVPVAALGSSIDSAL